MPLLIASQVGHCLSEASLILLGQWLPVLHREIGVQVVRQRTSLVVKILDLPLRFKYFVDLVLIATSKYLFAGAPLVSTD